jgi:ferredoxin
MAKNLKVTFPEKCIGCELCTLEVQRQLQRVGLEGSLIRIFKEKQNNQQILTFTVELDPLVHKLDLIRIREICPTGVFTVEEKEENDELLS